MRITSVKSFGRFVAAGSLLALALLTGGVLTSRSTASAGGYDPCQLIDYSAQAVQQEPEVPCEITLTKDLVGKSSVDVGDNVVFEITVTNTGWASLESMVLVDTFDSSVLSFQSANPAPTEVDDGVLYWEDLTPSPDGDVAGHWEFGETRTITVRFRAAHTSDGTQNCAIAGAIVAFGDEPQGITAMQQEPEVDVMSEEDCARLTIDKKPPVRKDPTATATAPAPTPSPVVTVLPATVVPKTPPTGVTLPDTGNGPGGDGGSNAGLIIAAAIGMAILAGGALRFHRSR